MSLAALFDGVAQPGAGTGASVPDLMRRIVIGGWPDLLGADETEARGWLADYLRQIVEVDVPSFVGRRDPRTLERVLASLGRFVAHSPATRAIAADVGGDRGPISSNTIYSHLDALDRLQLRDDSEAWQPHMRSRSRLRTTPTRYFVDPSIGTAALHVGSTDLLRIRSALVREPRGCHAPRSARCTHRGHRHGCRGPTHRWCPRDTGHGAWALTRANSRHLTRCTSGGQDREVAQSAGPVDPAGYFSKGTLPAAQESRTGWMIRQHSSASSARTDSATSPSSSSSSTSSYERC